MICPSMNPELLKETTDSFIEHVERLKATRSREKCYRFATPQAHRPRRECIRDPFGLRSLCRPG